MIKEYSELNVYMVGARDAANRVQKYQWRLNMIAIIFTLTGLIILYKRVHCA